MAKTCNNCGSRNITSISYVAHESALSRAERIIKRLIAVIVLLIILLVGSNTCWMIYEGQFSTSTTSEEYLIEQSAGVGNMNAIINGGEISNG